MPVPPSLLFIGDVIDPGASPGELRLYPNYHLLVAADGFIEYLGSDPPSLDTANHVLRVNIPNGCAIMPGFIDTHVHAAQIQYAGTGTDLPLMKWLTKYAFPSERRLTNDLNASEHVYDELVRKLIRSGTTTALYFAVIGVESSKVLADVACRNGQRAFVGKVAMDRLAPKDYIETTEEAADGTESFILYVRNECKQMSSFARACAAYEPDKPPACWKERDLALVEPAVTPRFVPCCTEPLLQKLGALSQKYGVLIQSHAVESVDCLDTVQELHPGRNEVEIFETNGLLSEKSVIAHCVHITENQAEVFKNTGTGIACCPLSNFYFASGMLRTAALLEEGHKVGFGTDVAGGYSHRMLDSIRHAMTTHLAIASADANVTRSLRGRDTSAPEGREAKRPKREADNESNHSNDFCASTPRCDAIAPGAGHVMGRDSFNYAHAFWTATVGGSRCLGLEKVGRLLPGQAFDACIVDLRKWLVKDPSETDRNSILTAFEKFIHLGCDEDIIQVYIQGRRVHGED